MSADVFFRDFFGVRAGMVLPTIPEDAPTAIREGIARRRIVMVTGECPCGAVLVPPNRAERRRRQRAGTTARPSVRRLEVRHESDCEAVDQNLLDALKAWKR